MATARTQLPSVAVRPARGAGNPSEQAGGRTPRPRPPPPPPPPLPSRPPPPPLVGQHRGCRTFCLSSRSQSAALRLPRDCPSVKPWERRYRARSRSRPAGGDASLPLRESCNWLFRFGTQQRPRGTRSPWLGRGSDSVLYVVR